MLLASAVKETDLETEGLKGLKEKLPESISYFMIRAFLLNQKEEQNKQTS